MAYDPGLRIFICQFLQQLIEGMLLGFGAGVASLSLLVQSALVHNAERAVVVMPGMYPLHAFGKQRDYLTISAYIVVVGTLTIFGLTTGDQVFYAEWAITLGSGAVHHKQRHLLKRFQRFLHITDIFFRTNWGRSSELPVYQLQ